ncbi:MAG: exodeoxyribonuclease III [Candidatus Vogelbacteria bacterium]|nr:exodeoxyribonuclease III [Candidatus Vogelbacteria bacterium]
MELKLLSWNVNGIRAAVKNGFGNMLLTERPDILGLQEIKITDKAREEQEFDFTGYKEYWNPAVRPGYSGTAILIKNYKLKIINYKAGMGIEEFDTEGRVQTLEFEDFYFVNTYFPNSNHELSRLKYKTDFNAAWLEYIKKLEQKKPVIACGDFNVAHEEIDLARPKDNVGNAGFTNEERADMTKFLAHGLVDTYRAANSDKVQYSWWSYRFYARDRNIGWRIDYFLTSEKINKNIKESFILDDVLGSDHCPVGIKLKT